MLDFSSESNEYGGVTPLGYTVFETVYKIRSTLFNVDHELKFLETGETLFLKGKNSTSVRIDVEAKSYVVTLIDDQGYNGFIELSKALNYWHPSTMPPVVALEIQRSLTPFYKKQWWELMEV